MIEKQKSLPPPPKKLFGQNRLRRLHPSPSYPTTTHAVVAAAAASKQEEEEENYHQLLIALARLLAAPHSGDRQRGFSEPSPFLPCFYFLHRSKKRGGERVKATFVFGAVKNTKKEGLVPRLVNAAKEEAAKKPECLCKNM